MTKPTTTPTTTDAAALLRGRLGQLGHAFDERARRGNWVVANIDVLERIDRTSPNIFDWLEGAEYSAGTLRSIRTELEKRDALASERFGELLWNAAARMVETPRDIPAALAELLGRFNMPATSPEYTDAEAAEAEERHRLSQPITPDTREWAQLLDLAETDIVSKREAQQLLDEWDRYGMPTIREVRKLLERYVERGIRAGRQNELPAWWVDLDPWRGATRTCNADQYTVPAYATRTHCRDRATPARRRRERDNPDQRRLIETREQRNLSLPKGDTVAKATKKKAAKKASTKKKATKRPAAKAATKKAATKKAATKAPAKTVTGSPTAAMRKKLAELKGKAEPRPRTLAAQQNRDTRYAVLIDGHRVAWSAKKTKRALLDAAGRAGLLSESLYRANEAPEWESKTQRWRLATGVIVRFGDTERTTASQLDMLGELPPPPAMAGPMCGTDAKPLPTSPIVFGDAEREIAKTTRTQLVTIKPPAADLRARLGHCVNRCKGETQPARVAKNVAEMVGVLGAIQQISPTTAIAKAMAKGGNRNDLPEGVPQLLALAGI